MRELLGRVAVITGGGSGIGEALARACAAEGMRVVLGDVEPAAAERVAEELRGEGGEALALGVDVRDPAALHALAESCYSRFGACHLLMNNAGVVAFRPAAATRLADWEWVLSVNLYGVVHGLDAFLPRMRAQGGEAHVVNTASIAGLTPLAGLVSYVTSKYAVVGLSEALREELAADGIGVSVVCPGGVATRITESERNRPEELRSAPVSAPSAAAVPDRAQLESAENVLPPSEVAAQVLEAVRENELYVLTHPDRLEQVRERHAAIEAAFQRAASRSGAHPARAAGEGGSPA